ncbi:hypothetical protein LTR27_008815 [Elasticomyces elasticus]|nr:hypothetical protein LTR27_008815 [Elasticomyces elasticus]
MPASFEARKAKILSELDTPDEQYEDLSPKGSLDIGIRDLISEINAVPHCAGRVAAYLEGTKGAKGGGLWLFTSHDPIEVPTTDGAVYELLGLSSSDVQAPTITDEARFVHLKFEPMILHILASTIPAAQTATSAALTAGFRESGITGNLNQSHNHAASPMVAVRSSGLAFDCVIGYSTPEHDDQKNGDSEGVTRPRIVPMVSEAYLRTLLSIANQRFKTNEERRERFRGTLMKA